MHARPYDLCQRADVIGLYAGGGNRGTDDVERRVRRHRRGGTRREFDRRRPLEHEFVKPRPFQSEVDIGGGNRSQRHLVAVSGALQAFDERAEAIDDDRFQYRVLAREVLIHCRLGTIYRLRDPANRELLDAFIFDDRSAYINDVVA